MPFRILLVLMLCSCGRLGAQNTPEPVKPQASGALASPRAAIGAAAQRNENVAVYQIDTNVTKELNVRVGANPTIVTEMPAESNYYAAEHGQPPSGPVVVHPTAKASSWRGELFEAHQNSVFNARTFFQVGPVLPSRRNFYAARAAGALPLLGYVNLSASQRKVRGMVNGNVLAPLASERTPLASDPAVRRIISRWMEAYPLALPNRLDFDPRALNTNAPQRSDTTEGTFRAEPKVGAGRMVLSHYLQRHNLDAFQLVAGQNPDTSIHSHRSRLTYERTLSAASTISVGLGFDRTKSALTPEPNAVGPRVRFGYQIEELGPDSQFPINRAQNSFRGGFLWSHADLAGGHALAAGAEVVRYQLNGIEVNNQRGLYWFTNNYGRTAIENFRYGTPSMYEVTIGELARGFRNWGGSAYFGDRWKITPHLQFYWGLRYSLETAPREVRGLTEIPYGCDCNNFSPRISFAWSTQSNWVVRTAYATVFGQILPVTYQQARMNLPHVRYVQVQNPDFLNPLAGVRLDDPAQRTSPTFLSPDMVAPYTHVYSLSIERRLAERLMIRIGYVGSRTFKLLNVYQQNRAEPVPGIPLTTATVDQRRPDPRYYDVKYVLNGGIAYLDAAKLTLHMPSYRGLVWSANYTFGKAIDEGTDYTFTAANRDMQTGRNQWQYDSAKDRKGLSLFDSTHALEIAFSYDLPKPARKGWVQGVLSGWNVSGVTVFKSGTPLTLYVGSDGPGYGNVDGGAGDRPNILDPSILGRTIAHPDTAPQILRRDRFSYLAPGQHAGTLGRGTFRKSPIANLNAAIAKEWRFRAGREWRAMLRGEAYNAGNHAQFDEPQRNLSSPAFGKITNTLNDGRVLQIAVRFML